MDETLIHCKQTGQGGYDFQVYLHDPLHHKRVEMQVNVRPYLYDFL